MTDAVVCDQLLYGWAGSGSRQGYQPVAASSGVTTGELRYIELHAMPVSFMPGDFDSCIRKYVLPSGRITISFVKNAGRDELGRTGAYYAHFIIIPGAYGASNTTAVPAVIEALIKDPEEAYYVIRSFGTELMELPQLRIPGGIMRGRSEPRRIFASPDDFAAFLFGISSRAHTVVMTVPEGSDTSLLFTELNSMLSPLPSLFSAASITTYSGSIPDETSLFNVFLLPVYLARGNIPENGRTLLFENGALQSPHHKAERFLELSNAIWNSDSRSLSRFSALLDDIPTGIAFDSRIRYAMAELKFEKDGAMDDAVWLLQNAPSEEYRSRYHSKLRAFVDRAGNFGKLSELYLQKLRSSGSGEADGVLIESLLLLSFNKDMDIVSSYLNDTFKVYSTLGDQYPFLGVFDCLTGRDGKHHSGLCRFIQENKTAFRRYVADFLPSGGRYKGFSQVRCIVTAIADEKKASSLVRSIFYRGISEYDLRQRLEFIEDYVDSTSFGLQLAYEMMKDTAKEARRSEDESVRKRFRFLMEKLVDRGLQEKETDKLRKLVEIN